MEYNNYINNQVPTIYGYREFDGIDQNPEDLKKTAFNSLLVENLIFIPYGKPEILEISNIIIEPMIIKRYAIKTIVNKSLENIELTGNKLMIELNLKQIIEYISNDEINTSKCIIEYQKVNTYITLPSDYKFGFKTQVRISIDNVLSKIIDRRNLSVVMEVYLLSLSS